jgi:hypothetical protein
MIKTMPSQNFVHFYADVMRRDIEWRDSHQFEVVLYLLVLRPFLC